MSLRLVHRTVLVVALAGLSLSAFAKDKQDQIELVAHIPAAGAPVTHLLTTQHYRRQYLYAERQSGSVITLIDVTNISHPAVLAEMTDPGTSSDTLVAVAGSAALAATTNSPTSAQTFRILSFADPLHPTVEREFKGVTALARDDRRGLIFLANSAGIWILQQRFAMDPQFEKKWEHMMLDAR
jgi:hypothetical protein